MDSPKDSKIEYTGNEFGVFCNSWSVNVISKSMLSSSDGSVPSSLEEFESWTDSAGLVG